MPQMFFRTIGLAAAFAVAAHAGSATAQEADASTVVATVEGTEITIGHMIMLRDSLPEQYKSIPDDVMFGAVLEQLIEHTVLSKREMNVPPAVTYRMENEERTLLASVAMAEVADAAVTDEAIQAAYEERFAGTEPETEYNASHILVETEEEALALITELENGADFAGLAREKSTGPSGPSGGELGWFGPGMMVKAFEDAVFAMDVGSISAPVQTQFGWHVIKLNESRIKAAPALDEVREELEAEIRQKAIDKDVEAAISSAQIERPDISGIDPSILRDVELVLD